MPKFEFKNDRRFGDQTYTHWSDHKTKSAAQTEASEHNYARVVKTSKGYRVFVRR